MPNQTNLPNALYKGVLPIGDIPLDCAVLDNGDGAIPYFRPLNDRFPTLNADEYTRIIGVVREKVKRY